jgi:hypothetical protein
MKVLKFFQLHKKEQRKYELHHPIGEENKLLLLIELDIERFL